MPAVPHESGVADQRRAGGIGHVDHVQRPIAAVSARMGHVRVMPHYRYGRGAPVAGTAERPDGRGRQRDRARGQRDHCDDRDQRYARPGRSAEGHRHGAAPP